MNKASIIIFSFLLVMGAIGLSITTNASADADKKTVDVLIDFGDGVIKWREVGLTENYTAINATEKACKELELTTGISWSDYGASLYQVGNKQNMWPGAWWHFWLWNSMLNDWEYSHLGASSVILDNNSVIAWSCVGDDEKFTPLTKPIPTPTNKYSSVSFRNNIYNTGSSELSSIITNDVMWKFNTTSYEVDASPAVAYGNVYITTWTGFYCLNENNGSVVWNTSTIKGISSPAIYDGKVFVGSTDGKLYSLNAITGEILWNITLQQDVVYTGISSSPKILNDKIFIGTSNETGGSGKIYAIYADNGTIIWNYTTSSVYLSTASISENKLFIGLMGIFNTTSFSWAPPYGVLCLNTDNGSLVWVFQTNGSVASSPAVYANSVYFTSKDGGLYRVDMNGTEIWRKEIGTSTSSPAIVNNTIYVGSGTFGPSGKIRAFDENGNKLWEFVPNGGVQSSITVGNGKLFFATNTQNGTIYSIDANGNLLWKSTPKPENYILGSPVIADNKLFVASDNGFIYCFGPGVKPTASFIVSNQTIKENDAVAFDASNSTDACGDIVNYTWEFGDGNVGYGKTVNHTYSTSGKFKANLTITDDDGSTNTTAVEVSVLEIAKEKTKTNGFISGYETIFLAVAIISILCCASKSGEK
ncbi:MAG: PQQ-binding-like beta-propeller repeat protein [Thermoplasmata archaeon]